MLPALRSSPLVVAVTAFAQASPRLTLALAVVATALGLLQPAFVIATGVLVETIASSVPIVPPLVVLGAIFAATRMLGPIRDELGQALWRRVDESMGDRIMCAVSAQPGLQLVEDPRIQDLVAQAEGAVTGYSVGQAAQMLPMMYSQRLFGAVSLLIVGRTYWWAALVLAVAHIAGYQVARWHWNQVTTVILARTDRMRRSFYLRGLALSSSVAKETRVFGLADWLVDSYRRASLAVLQDLWGKRHEGWLVGVGLALLVSITEVITIWLVATDSVSGNVSLGTAVAVVQAVFAAGFLSTYQDPDWSVTQAAMSVEKVGLLERTAGASGVELPGTRDPAGLPARAIRFEDVSFAYPESSRVIFRNFNLTIEAGASLAIVGENGAGKTTLVKLLARLYEPDTGRITVDGIDLRELEPAAWHRRIAAVFQDFVQFELMAYDNVAFGAVRAFDDRDAVERSAERAGADALIRRLPQGWATPLSRELSHGSQLSGGEWQRLALARALFGVQAGAGVLILDEPTASLDVRAEAEVYRRFLELTRGVTTIVISHRFSTVRRADRIVVVDAGQVVESGSHEELMALNNGHYATMYRLQAARFTSVESG